MCFVFLRGTEKHRCASKFKFFTGITNIFSSMLGITFSIQSKMCKVFRENPNYSGFVLCSRRRNVSGFSQKLFVFSMCLGRCYFDMVVFDGISEKVKFF